MALILIVEDDATSLKIMSAIVHQLHHTPLRCRNGQSAYEFIKENADVLSLVVTDIMMPDLDGHELIKKIKKLKNTATLPIIVQSAYLGVQATAEILDSGASAVLHKPINRDQLTEYINRFTNETPESP